MQRILNPRKSKVAVLVVDMNELKPLAEGMQRTATPAKENHRREIAIGNICRVTNRAAELGIPVIFTNMNNEIVLGLNERIVATTKGSFTEFPKMYFDSFRETGLDESLKEAGIKTLVECGFHRAFCLKETTKKGLELGYRIITSNSLIIGWAARSHQYFDLYSCSYRLDNTQKDFLLGSLGAMAYYGRKTDFCYSTSHAIKKMERAA